MSCPELWRAAALRDGRLSGAQREEAERHELACDACREEREALASLAHRLRSLPVRAPDAFSMQRARRALLIAADAAQTGNHRRRVRRPLPAVLGAVVAVAVGVSFWASVRSRELGAEAGKGAPSLLEATHDRLDVEPEPGADWSHHHEVAHDTLTLREGALTISVRHGAVASTLLVRTPDAEIDDVGTTFTVVVERGRTTRVAVEEGKVVLRRGSEGALELSAGERWVMTPPATDSPIPPSQVSGAIPPRTPPASPGRTAAYGRLEAPSASPPSSAAPSPTGESDRSVAAIPSSTGSRLGVDEGTRAFASATEMLAQGRNADAAAALGSFLDRFPEHGRREDALYLRAAAFARAGRSGSAREAAKRYLLAHPEGFRAPEMRALAE